MGVHKLAYDEMEEDEFTLFAIHASLLNFRMAYFINKTLNTRLKIAPKEITITDKKIDFSFVNYEYYDKKLDRYWKLIENKTTAETIHIAQIGLFQTDNYTSQYYLIPEFKKIDYLLKIENMVSIEEISLFLKQLTTIAQVETAYILPNTILKTKKNLLF